MHWVRFAVLLLIALVVLDAAGRQLLGSSTRFSIVASTQPSDRVLLVYFPGILADGEQSSSELIRTWRTHGDVLRVSYIGKRFDGAQVALQTAGEIRWLVDSQGYTRVVFLGASMGGLLSYDTYRQLKKRPLVGVDFGFVLMDAPTKRTDFQPPLDTLSLIPRFWYAGPIGNLLRPVMMRFLVVPPKAQNIESGVNRAELAKRVAEARSFPLSFWADQIRYMENHGAVAPGSLAGTTVIYVRSTRDTDTVRPRAFNPWNTAADGEAIHIDVDSTHVGFNERPETWRLAFGEKIFPALGLG